MTLLLPLLLAASGGRAEVVVPVDSYSVEGGRLEAPGLWWESFSDPALDQVVAEAMEGNLDLAAAARRADQAHHLARQAASPLLPMVSFDVSNQLQPCDSVGLNMCEFSVEPGADVPDTYTQGRAGVNGSWGVDIWGRSISTANAGRLEALAADGDQQALALLISTRTVEGWFDVGFAEGQLSIVQGQEALNLDLMEIVTLRHERTEATALDLLQQRQQLAAVQAQLPTARTRLRVAQQQLAVLLGRSPTDAPFTATLPEVPPLPDIGTPADLLVNRPDLVASAQRVSAALARERATEKAVLPTVGLSGGYNRSFQTVDETESVDTWSAGVALSVPLFMGGSKVSGIGAARANTDSVTLSANQAILRAIAEVEGALVRDQEAALRRQATQVQLEAAELAFDEARARYADGLGHYLELLTSLQALQNAQLSELSAHRDQLSARVALYAALGWNP